MTIMRRIHTLLLAAGAILTTLSAAAMIAVAPASGSKIRLEGTSTLHPFASETEIFRFDLVLEPAAASQGLGAAIQAQAPAKLTVAIPVATLKSEHAGLDKNLQKALKADKNPEIVFVMKGYNLLKDGGTTIVAWGDLSVAGQTRAETLNASLSVKDGRAVIDGQQPLLMTDFGVKPPSMMMGAVKTGDRVVIKFHLVLEPADGKSNEGKGAK